MQILCWKATAPEKAQQEPQDAWLDLEEVADLLLGVALERVLVGVVDLEGCEGTELVDFLLGDEPTEGD